MKIIAHRGFWKKLEEKNTIESFIKAFDSGYGIETDIRDDRGQLVISHDMSTGTELTLSEFFKLLKGRNLPVAINIKSDGLVIPLKKLVEEYQIQNYFTFDMSFAESRRYVKANLNPLISLSEFQPKFERINEYHGVWLDAFEGEWYSPDNVHYWANTSKTVCIVSPELHGRPHEKLWSNLKKQNAHKIKNLSICTDFPDLADRFFNEVTT